ncbi:MAG: alpha/beta fold hydrolase [Myxococcota bacterium]
MLKLLCVVLPLGWLLAGVVLTLVQRSLVFPGAGQPPLNPAWAAAVGAVPVDVPAADGTRLKGWLSGREHDRLILFFHSNGGSLSSSGELHRRLTRQGWAVLAITWRGYPGSDGAPTADGLRSDALGAYAYAHETLAIPEHRIAVFGHSLGGALAVHVAGKRSPGALVVDSSFSRLSDVVQDKATRYPVRWLLWDEFDSVALAPNIQTPTFVVHSTTDQVVPFAQGQALGRAFPNAEWAELQGFDHNALVSMTDPSTHGRMRALLERAIPRR